MAYTDQDIHSGTASEGLSTKDAQDLETALNNINDSIVAGGAVVALTDNSGGTGADTIAVIGATYSQTEVANAIASLADKVNELIAAMA